MSLLREKKKHDMDVMNTALKGVHAQASCFMYVDFLGLQILSKSNNALLMHCSVC